MSKNLHFDFAPDVRPVSESPTLAPIAPSADLTAKHCSSMGALEIEKGRETYWALMLQCYQRRPHTDAELAHFITWFLKRRTPIPTSTISARRAELIAQGKVAGKSCGTKKNPETGVSNSLWQLAVKDTDGTRPALP